MPCSRRRIWNIIGISRTNLKMDRRRRTCNGKAVSAKPALGQVTPARVPSVPGLGETEEKAIGCADDLGALAQVGV
ncbi:unnamed protein product [Macrosiphum euphorbiae]|uniref:Uncharacterized protein n=1 Tax=Macrosiphum euphorbiae TaxID=13131 RepID=A0AAV0VES8_9HEMI|nr:unnamed protein product [Macrosiphum euphorbiae]